MNTEKVEISACEQQLIEAMRQHDVDTLESLLHDDLLFVIPTGQVVTKQMDLENYRSGNLVISDIITHDQQVSLVADNAVVSVVLNLKGAYLDQPIDGMFRYIRTWKRFNEQWKVIAGAGMQIG